MTFPVSRPIPQTQRDFRFEHRTAGHRRGTVWEDLRVLSAYDAFHSLTFYGEVSGLGTKCIVVRGLWNVVLHRMCDRAVLPKELDEKISFSSNHYGMSVIFRRVRRYPGRWRVRGP